MKFRLVISLMFVHFALLSQDGMVERRFLLEREKIKERKIKQITELSVQNFNGNGCMRDSAEFDYIYKFDREGNLVEIIRFHSTGMKITSYTRNGDGTYSSKKYLFADKIGTVKFEDNWHFELNSKNQVIKQEWKRGERILRTNIFEYNDSGRQKVQTSDNYYRWTMDYDSVGNLVTFKEWRRVESDSFKCISITAYEYDRHLLTKEVTTSAASSEIWRDIDYKYDSLGNPVTTVKRRTTWRTINNGPRESIITTYVTKHLTDNAGNVIVSSEFYENKDEPFHCVFFDYRRWGN